MEREAEDPPRAVRRNLARSRAQEQEGERKEQTSTGKCRRGMGQPNRPPHGMLSPQGRKGNLLDDASLQGARNRMCWSRCAWLVSWGCSAESSLGRLDVDRRREERIARRRTPLIGLRAVREEVRLGLQVADEEQPMI